MIDTKHIYLTISEKPPSNKGLIRTASTSIPSPYMMRHETHDEYFLRYETKKSQVFKKLLAQLDKNIDAELEELKKSLETNKEKTNEL